ncbi:Bacteriophage holin of superfamily 6 (Holin_LLH) [Natronincola peptidivorans]|uniref:Bacteriophage holin of superfamily 6 (Holin_LLH) n=1 Tax=Natronincola peptidivorans TaxID=426128 RepID=A0A1I0FA00_9FIRM|nr:phage holin, LLH family [Natronincola peptidivorans]SET54947.1 Bacteriophage holin of superfamily 6 (Holin_LLH) [Natronincola peptidivorans]
MDRELIMLFLDFGVKAVVMLVIALAGYFLRKYNMERWAVKAVMAAEQIWQHIPGSGEEKKAYVKDFLSEKFKYFGLTKKEVETLIESVVKEIKDNKLPLQGIRLD